MTDPTLNLVPPPGLPPGQPMQILLPQPLQDVMQQWPSVLTRLTACEAKPAPPQSVGLVALASALVGAGGMALLVFLWQFKEWLWR